MATMIEIDDGDYTRLQGIARPFEDTPATVIRKLLDSYQAGHARTHDNADNAQKAFGPLDLPPLTHTKVMKARFDDKKPTKENWDGLLKLALLCVLKHTNDIEEMKRIAGCNAVAGSRSDSGYKYCRDGNFSYQNVSAEDAMKIVLRCAKQIGVTVEVDFEWRNKTEAYKPGERGQIFIPSH